MAFPVWNQSFSVSVKRCDEDHQKLFACIQRLHDAIEANLGPEAAENCLMELVEYTNTHFSAEEALLEQTGFPDLPRHRFQHRTFITNLQELADALKFAPRTTPLALLEYLKNWLVRHIKMVDCQYSTHLNAHGIH